MSKHTVFVEAPPFAKFSDAEMRRLLDDERLEVLDWRGKRVNTPGFVEALATADIAVTGNSLTITDELLEKPDVDGGLIGGASLKADAFGAIVAAASK